MCRRRDRSGFTLVEMLAVVVIIGLLMAMLLGVVELVRGRAQEAIAHGEVKSLESAWKQYYAEYKQWPTFAGETTPVAITGGVADLLRGSDDADTNNVKRMEFMEFSRLNGVQDPVNPWGDVGGVQTGYYYYAMFDVDYDHVIAGPSGDVPRSVIVWTVHGEDGSIIGSWD
jgi:prepilin-type N-terminal cleavage/methylation domain-containing protein